ncbi:MAG TPA: NTP transferase domain-containing protein [Polyangiaceae bacterium]|jgi:bifunctional UDP-N-acetylglucosamine pyrophosphorylase/glucosamine-1-phosphate N-acetyltransferase
MERVFDESEAPPERCDPRRWTAVVPAAGLATRLGHDLPKILYPVAGRAILAWLLDLLDLRCARIVLVLSPAGFGVVPPVARGLATRSEIVCVVQESARGMGDAVLRAEAAVATTNVLVVWGDQVTLRGQTLDRLCALHERRPDATLTLATVLRPEPYIHFGRDDEGRIVRVYQRREEAIPVDVGENDCGVFAFASRPLFERLREADAAPLAVGARERNLLPLFPTLETHEGAVATLRLHDVEETLGVNTPEDGIRAAAILMQRGTVHAGG